MLASGSIRLLPNSSVKSDEAFWSTEIGVLLVGEVEDAVGVGLIWSPVFRLAGSTEIVMDWSTLEGDGEEVGSDELNER